MTPALAVILLAHITILRHFGSGPLWPEISQFLSKNCIKYWWSTLLYVQNYVNPNELCLGQTWYLSVDMQLFIVSPLILYPLAKWPRPTIGILFGILGLGVISPTVIAYYYELSPTITLVV